MGSFWECNGGLNLAMLILLVSRMAVVSGGVAKQSSPEFSNEMDKRQYFDSLGGMAIGKRQYFDSLGGMAMGKRHFDSLGGLALGKRSGFWPPLDERRFRDEFSEFNAYKK